MKVKLIRFLVQCAILLIILGCTTKKIAHQTDLPTQKIEVELRGVWIASVLNIDWPASSNLSLDELKSSYLKILDFYQALHFNAVFVQIRTAGDALFPSQFAPWSRFLTGKEGRALAEDILPWLIDEAHVRGMEFHAWMNPYRATTSLDTTILSKAHAFNQHRDWMIKYGSKYYFNPALPEVQSHLLDVINEVITTYDVDGIHFDDYFYPYKIDGEVFSDNLQFAQRKNKAETIANWRRNNINTFIQSCHNLITFTKPHIQFGVSPFGVWRNKSVDASGSATRAGQTVYDHLYADTRHWIQNGWMDYIAPQLYWSMDYPAASHRILADWWTNEAEHVPLYIGLGAYKFQNNADTSWNDLDELVRQINYDRSKGADGFIVFSAKSLLNKPELTATLRQKTFKKPTLTSGQDLWTQSKLSFKSNIEQKGKMQNIVFFDIDPRAKRLLISYSQKRLLKKEEYIKQIIDVVDGQASIHINKRIEQITVQGINSMRMKTRVTVNT